MLVSKAKQEVRKDWPVPKPAGRAAFCPRLWLHQPLTFSEKTWAPFSFPSGAAFSQGNSKLQASSATKSTDRSHHMSKMEKRRHRDPVRGVGPNFTSPPL